MNKLIFFLLTTLLFFQCKTSDSVANQNMEPGGRIAFYNVENLFDTVDDPKTLDEEFLPTGKKQWTTTRYQAKLDKLSKVIQGMEFPDLLGVCEVENKTVLEDWTQTKLMQPAGYGVVHYESPDRRGIDNGFLYKKSAFQVISSDHYRIDFPPSIVENYLTRDILYIEGTYKNQTVHVFVNHWPSRRGGVKASEPKRNFVAEQLRKRVDEIYKKDAQANIIIMGDFNDETDNNSIANSLKATSPTDQLQANQLYNLFALKDKAGEGSYKYRANWNMLDQIMVSGSLLNSKNGVKVNSGTIYQPTWLSYKDKKYGNRPNKTYGGPNYYGGFSDHYPVYVEMK